MTSGRVASEHEVLLHLHGIGGPVTTAELVTAVRRAHAPAHVVSTLERLPDRRWASIEEAVAAIGTGWRSDEVKDPGAGDRP